MRRVIYAMAVKIVLSDLKQATSMVVDEGFDGKLIG